MASPYRPGPSVPSRLSPTGSSPPGSSSPGTIDDGVGEASTAEAFDGRFHRPDPPEPALDRLRRVITSKTNGDSPVGAVTSSVRSRLGLVDRPVSADLERSPELRAGWRRVVVSGLGVVAVAVIGWWFLRPPAPPVEVALPSAGDAPVSPAPTIGGAAGPGSVDAGPVMDGSAGSAGGSTGSGQAAADGVVGGDMGEAAAASVVVHASGAVASPGVYRLDVGARVDDLVRAAGGLTPEGDADRVNLAAPLVDGERVWVPRRGEADVPAVVAGGSAGGGTSTAPGSESSAGGGGGGSGGLIDLNRATAEELDTLPGVGPATAVAILAHRDENGSFATVDDLLEVSGIGEAKLEQIRPLVRT